jgi:Spy/CpxP family protein refolding chaperone
VIAGLAALVLAMGLGAAQERGTEAAPPGERRAPREEAFKMIDAYVVSNMQESLQLTDEQFVKVLPLVKHLQTDRRELIERRQQALQELRRSLAAGEATEPKVVELLKRVKAAESDESTVVRRDRDAVDAALTPLQQAKFRILEIEVEHKIRELMNQIRAERRGPGDARRPRPRPSAP